MRTSPLNHFTFCVPIRSTKHGKSAGPLSGAHATGAPCSPATDVKVPHSWATRLPGARLKSAEDRRTADRINVTTKAVPTISIPAPLSMTSTLPDPAAGLFHALPRPAAEPVPPCDPAPEPGREARRARAHAIGSACLEHAL